MAQGQVLVLVERDEDEGTVRRTTCVLLTVARRLGEPVAVVCGAPPDEAAVRALGRFGATRICVAESVGAGRVPHPTRTGVHVEASTHVPHAARADALVALAGRLSPVAILISAGYAGQETAGRVAVRLDSGVITDAVDVRPGPDRPVAVQSCLAHSYLVESSVVRGIPVITVRSEAAVPIALPADAVVDPVVEVLPIPASPHRAPRLISSARKPKNRTPPLESADVVVAGGRGVGSAESFRILADLAAALGGAVGGSHTATELGWISRDRRIGLTGTTVHPRLYLASGVSGSVRHRAGMQGAKTVVAIGDDPAAPIFRIADLGVVGDVHQVLPALLAEITRRKARRSLSSSIDSPSDRDLTEA